MSAFSLAGMIRLSVTGSGPGYRYLLQELDPLASDPGDPDIDLHVGRFADPKGHGALLHNRGVAVGPDWVRFASSHLGLRWRTLLSHLEARPIRVDFDGGRMAARVFLLKTLIPLIRHCLQRTDATLLKASAVAQAGQATLLAGWSGSGKTSAAVTLTDEGCDYLSDTFAVLGADGRVRPLPLMIHLFGRNLSPAILARLSSRRRSEAALKAVLYRLSLKRVNLSVMLPFEEMFSGRKVAPATPLARLVLLTPRTDGQAELERIDDPARVLRRVLCTEMAEAADFERVRLAYTHVNPDAALADYWQHAERILGQGLHDTETMELAYSGALPVEPLRLALG